MLCYIRRGFPCTAAQETSRLSSKIIKSASLPSSILPNGGGIRASIGAGDVTVGDIYNVLPFDNTLVVVELMGMDIIDALEHSVRLWPEQSGGFLQVSGISFEFVPDALPGGRVINVKVGDNAISAGRYYLVATNDFLAAGGDGYDTLKNSKLVADTGIMLRDVVVDYFLENGDVKEPEAGRIVVAE